jgi:hypothetical protein
VYGPVIEKLGLKAGFRSVLQFTKKIRGTAPEFALVKYRVEHCFNMRSAARARVVH